MQPMTESERIARVSANRAALRDAIRRTMQTGR